MSLDTRQLSLSDQLRLSQMSEQEKEKVLNMSLKDAEKYLNRGISRRRTHKDPKEYQPITDISGTTTLYHSKNVFSDPFEEKDIQNFIELYRNGFTWEFYKGEVDHLFKKMFNEGRYPIQCFIYSTKYHESEYYADNEKIIDLAKMIAVYVNEDPKRLDSIRHMLVNWGWTVYQKRLIILIWSMLRNHQSLDEIVRILYDDIDDLLIRRTLLKTFFRSKEEKNITYAYHLLERIDEANNVATEEYSVLRGAVQLSLENRRRLNDVFHKIDLNTRTRRHIAESVFKEAEDKFIKKINNASPDQKESILKEIRDISRKNKRAFRRQIMRQSRYIKQFKPEIQDIFLLSLGFTDENTLDRLQLTIGILDLDGQDRKGYRKIEERLETASDGEYLVYTFALMRKNDVYVKDFIETLLSFDRSDVQKVLSAFKHQVLSKELFLKMRQQMIKTLHEVKKREGISSKAMDIAIRNLGFFFDRREAYRLYDKQYIPIFIDYVGFDPKTDHFDEKTVSKEKIKRIFKVLEPGLGQRLFSKEAEQLLLASYEYVKDSDQKLAERINKKLREYHSGRPETKGGNV